MNTNAQSAPPFFLTDVYDDVTKKDVMSSRFWPIIVASINHIKDSTDSLVVGGIERFSDSSVIRSVTLTNRAGLNVVSMFADSTDPKSTIHFGGVYEATRQNGHNNIHVSVKSNNVKYIIRKIKDPQGDPINTLNNRWAEAKNYFAEQVSTLISRGLRNGGALGSDLRITLNQEAVTALAKVHMGGMNKMDVPDFILAHIESQYRMYLDKHKKALTCAEDIKQMFGNDKWVLLSDMNHGAVIVGAVSRQPLADAVSIFMKTGELPSIHKFKYIDAVVPLKRYKSFNDIDEDIRRDIEMQLTMLKLHTKSDGPLLPTSDSMERGEHVYTDLGAMTSGSYMTSPFIIVDKTI